MTGAQGAENSESRDIDEVIEQPSQESPLAILLLRAWGKRKRYSDPDSMYLNKFTSKSLAIRDRAGYAISLGDEIFNIYFRVNHVNFADQEPCDDSLTGFVQLEDTNIIVPKWVASDLKLKHRNLEQYDGFTVVRNNNTSY